MSNRVKASLILFLLILMVPSWRILFMGEEERNSFFLKEKPLIAVPAGGNSVKGSVVGHKGRAVSPPSESVYLSEKDLGIPVMAGGRVLPDTVTRKGTRIMFNIFIYMPLRTVVGFYEQRLNVKGSRGRGEKGEQYLLSYAKDGLISRDGYKLQPKIAKKGTRKRTNLVFQEGPYPNTTLIRVVHTSY